MDAFEFSFGKKELRKLAKKNRRGHTDEELDLRKENEELRKLLNDTKSQMGDLKCQLDAARKDAARR